MHNTDKLQNDIQNFEQQLNDLTQTKDFFDDLANSLWSCGYSLDNDNSTETKFNNLDDFNSFIESEVQPKIQLIIENDNSFLSETKSQVISSVNELNNIMQQKGTEVFDEEVRNQFEKEFIIIATSIYNVSDNIEKSIDNLESKLNNIKQDLAEINQETAETMYDETLGNEEWLKLHDMHPHSQFEDSDTDLVVDKELLKYTANEIVDKLENYNNKVVGLEPLKLDLNLIDATPENFAQRVEEIFVNVDIDKMNVINDFLKSVENDIFDKSPFEDIGDDLNHDVAYDLNTCVADVRDILDSDYVAENSQKLETSQPIKTEINQETAETMYDETLGNEEWLKLHDMHPHSQFEDSDTDLVVDAETAENYLKTVELSLEQNANKIDGIINNLPDEKKQEKLEKVQETSKKAEKIRGGKPSLIGKINKNKKVITEKSADVPKDDLTNKLDKNAR